MNIEKFNNQGLKIAFFILLFLMMLCTCINFIFFMFKTLELPNFILFIAFHILFLLSLSAVLNNITIEIFISAFEDDKKSSLRRLIYGGHRFLPIRNAVYVIIFIAAYIIMMQFLIKLNAIQYMALFLPTFAIIFNARHFLSGRVRFINGTYLFYKDKLNTVFSYYIDENGALMFLTSDGKKLETGISIADESFNQLKAEFKQNGLPEAPVAPGGGQVAN